MLITKRNQFVLGANDFIGRTYSVSSNSAVSTTSASSSSSTSPLQIRTTPGGDSQRRRSVPARIHGTVTPERTFTMPSHMSTVRNAAPNNFTDISEGAYDVIKRHPEEEDVYKVPTNNKQSFQVTYSPGNRRLTNPGTFHHEIPNSHSNSSMSKSGYVHMEPKDSTTHSTTHSTGDLSDYTPIIVPKESEPKEEPSPEKKFAPLPFGKNTRSNTLPNKTLPNKSVPMPNLPTREDKVYNEIPEVKSKSRNTTEGMQLIHYLF